MAKVLLTVTFRTHAEFPAEQTALAAVQQIVDPLSLGRLEQETDHPECFTFSRECDMSILSDQPGVNLHAIADRASHCAQDIVSLFVNVGIEDIHIIASSGVVLQPHSSGSPARLEFVDDGLEYDLLRIDLRIAVELLKRLSGMILSPESKLRGYDEILTCAAEEGALFVKSQIKQGCL